MICGITRPTCGTIAVKGRVAPILALGAGFDPLLSGFENALIGGAILGLRRSEIKKRIESIREFADIGEYFDQPLKLYSSGMNARLAFAVCAHVDADILIVDEALSVGDQAFQAKCEAYFHEFAKHGTLLMVSHALGYLQQTCDRIIWIEDGRIRDSGPPEAVLPRYMQELAPSRPAVPRAQESRSLNKIAV